MTGSPCRVEANVGQRFLHAAVPRCRSRPVWSTTSKRDHVFYVRINNSTRELPDADLAEYVADHWIALTALQ